jgi:hypothetical protein
MESNPNAYFYRHVAPGEVKRIGPWDADEQKLFLRVMKIHPPNSGKWGLFARHIPNRVGYQCRNFYHRLLASGGLDAPTSDDDGQIGSDRGNCEQSEDKQDVPNEEPPPPVAEVERVEPAPPVYAIEELVVRVRRSPQFVKFPRPLRK